jgi:hypothetical protein
MWQRRCEGGRRCEAVSLRRGSLEGVPWRRAKSNGESDDEVGEGRDEAHDTYSIASPSWVTDAVRSIDSFLANP